MTLHKEGRKFLRLLFFGLLLIWIFFWQYLDFSVIWLSITGVLFFLLFLLFAQFFRVPKRVLSGDKWDIVSPADGKVVVIEEIFEEESLQAKCRQISVFMSPINVHVNWFPIPGLVSYYKYHPGKYLVAWHPKSSTENERTTVVVDREDGYRVLFRQIAGAVARRIICYCKKGDTASHAGEFGFIKFGSRVDIMVPLEAEIKVSIGQKVTGRQTILARLPQKK
jgi:phosphatidylserine decarboxylase